jgi:DNA-binding NarL/FixJ family response regulator
MSRINVAIVEDDPDVRQSIHQLIDAHDDFYCAGVFNSAESFTEAFSQIRIDVVLMDITLPNLSGIQCIRNLKPKRPEVQYMICTSHSDTDRIFDSLCAGATGYLLKSITAEKLYESIIDVFNGGSPMSSQIARMVVNVFPKQQQDSAMLDKLTDRESQILYALSKGYQYKEIAVQLSLSVETIRTYVRRIYEKLQVHSKVEAINKAFPKSK